MSLLKRFFPLFAAALLCTFLLAGGITQEVPRGVLKGTVFMAENGKPLPNALVTLTYSEGFSGERPKPRRVHCDDKGNFDIKNLQAGLYEVEVFAKAHSAEHKYFIVSEGFNNSVKIALTPEEPRLEIYNSIRVFTPDEKPGIQLTGFEPSNSLKMSIYKIDLGAIAKSGGLETLLYSFSRPGTPSSGDPSKSGKLVQVVERKLNKDIEGTFTEQVSIPTQEEGFYWLQCQVGSLTKGTYLNISNIALVSKTSAKEGTCFVVDLKTGKPISGASIEKANGADLRKVATTDATGVASVQLAPGASEEEKGMLVARSGKSVAVVDFYRPDSRNASHRIFLYTDRSIYRPGDEVKFKGIVRKRVGAGYALPPSGRADVEIRDTDDNLVKRLNLPVSPRGTFNGSYTSNREDKPGVYAIKAKFAGAEDTYYANLAAYRKPEYSIVVTPTAKHFVAGQKASAVVKVEYYFGSPVVGAKVSAYITRSNIYAFGEDDENYTGYSEHAEQGGEYSEEVEATTNEKGEALLEFSTKAENEQDAFPTDFEYTISASVHDQSNHYFNGEGKALVTRGEFGLRTRCTPFIAEPGEHVTVTATAQEYETKAPVAGQPVEFQVGHDAWEGNESHFVPLRTLSAVTDGNGVAVVDVPVGKDGSLVVRTTAKDRQGNSIRNEDYIYVDGDSDGAPAPAKVSVLLDKKTFHIGDTCRAMIQTDQPGSSVLFTVEADRVLYSRVVSLDKTSTVIDFPVIAAYAPNVTIAIAGVKGKRFIEASAPLKIDYKEQRLNVQVIPEQKEYLPGSRARVNIKTTDYQGRPVAADLSLAVVDESIFSIKPDSTDITSGFFPARENEVVTSYSFNEIYLDGGDKGGGNIPVRSKFLDTAFWNPDVTTDANGNATIDVPLPDNLTSWRATVVGATSGTQVGMASANFRARKPLTVRLELPAYIVEGDRQSLVAIITNDSGQDADVGLQLSAKGAAFEGAASQTLHIKAAGSQPVTWPLKDLVTGSAEFTCTVAILNGPSDAEKRTVAVMPHGRSVVETHSGEIAGDTEVTVNVGPDMDRKVGRLAITVSPSIATAVYQSLDDLIDFPYGCTEQTVSRFFPAVALANTLKGMNVPNPELQARIPKIVEDGFARLAKMQHGDGSWGWWEYDEGDPYMTAYVMHALAQAKAAGYVSNRIHLSSTLTWAASTVEKQEIKPSNRAALLYLCFALAENGDQRGAAVGLKRLLTDTLSPTECSLAVLALSALHTKTVDPLLQNQLGHLRRMAVEEESTARYRAEAWAYGAETTAWPLLALTTVAPEDPLVPKLVRYLMLSRKADMWESTRDTSVVLLGLTKYLGKTKELSSPSDISVSVNGGAPKSIHFEPGAVFNANSKITIPVSELRQGANTIRFTKTGSSTCYYEANLRATETAENLPPVVNDSGLKISREYHILQPQRLENGEMQLLPSSRAVEDAQSGDIIEVQLTIDNTKEEREFILIEDPTPSNCRVTEREFVDEGEEWSSWWSQTIIRDDKVAFFCRQLHWGKTVLNYRMRAETPGLSVSLPTTIANMYDSRQSGSSGEAHLEVKG